MADKPMLTFSIWMNETLRYMYATLPNIKLKLNIAPIGTIARLYNPSQLERSISSRDCTGTHMYFSGVIGTLCLESKWLVVRARTWVMKAANSMCHVVKKRAV